MRSVLVFSLFTLCAASVHQADPVAKVTDGDLQLLSSGTKVVWLNVGDSKSVQVKELSLSFCECTDSDAFH